MANIALLIAGGSGNRMGQSIPKQFLTVNERPVIVYTLEIFQKHPEIDSIAVVCIKGWEFVLQAYINQFNITKVKHIIPGGKNGQESIRNGVYELEKYYSPNDIVLIHDAIRPMVSADIISDCIRVTREKGNAITVIPCAEAIIQTEDGNVSVGSYPRNHLRRTQTPLEAGVTDSVASCTLKIEMGEQVYFSMGSEKNIKLTTVEDIDIFKALLAEKRSDWLK